MSDADRLARLYPTMKEAPAAQPSGPGLIPTGEARHMPSPLQPAAAEPVQPAQPEPTAQEQRAERMFDGSSSSDRPVPFVEDPLDVFGSPENRLFRDTPQDPPGLVVSYGEPSVTSPDLLPLTIPSDLTLQAPEEFAQAKEGLVAAGFGHTLTASIARQAFEAVRNPVTLKPDETRALLVAKFGPQGADQKLAAAESTVSTVEKSWPGIRRFLDQTKLMNSPHVIEMLAARAAKRPGAR